MIRPRSGGYQADVIIAGTRHRKQFKTQEQAQAWEQGLLAEASRIGQEALQPTKGPTIGSIQRDAYTRLWAGTKNAHDAELVLKAVVKGIGEETELSTIDALTVDRYVRAMQDRKCAAGTINRHLSCIRKLLGFARSRGYISVMPVIEQLKEPEGRLRYYTAEETAAVLKACGELGFLDFAQLIRFLLWTGCRLGEALKLRWSEVSDGQVRFLVTKNGKARAIPLSPELLELLKNRKASSSSPLVFPGWDHFRVTRAWAAVKERAKLDGDDAVMHTWRHTCASRMIQVGICLTVVQKWLGHSTVQMTMRYAHLAPTALDGARDKLWAHVTKGRDSVTGDVSQPVTPSQAC